MLTQILIGSVLMLITTVIHGSFMSLGVRWLILAYRKPAHLSSLIRRSLVVGVMVLIMFAATLVEATVWAVTYSLFGALAGFEDALYFSIVTYTTLGYGDVVLGQGWRLLSSFQAANGIVMFGWTTALIIVAIRVVSRSLSKLQAIN